MAKISVFGGGAWGKALHFAFGEKNDSYIISRKKLNSPYQISQTQAQNSDFFVVAICSSALELWLKDSPLPQESKILVASKGIANGLFVSDIFSKFYPKAQLSFLAGPSFAKEVAQSLPCALNVHSNNLQIAQEWLDLFPNFIKPYTNDDIIGGEIGGAYKNVIAIASGICEGMRLGNNARASLIARGLVEMTRFGKFFGAKEETFLGLSGAGDLFLTANSTLSRNFRVGLALAQNKQLQEILDNLGEVAEGVQTSKEIYALAQKNEIYTPIAKEVALIMEGKDPKSSLMDLMKRMN
ncbi:NAD(P)H-dependent glycerol-3-phosphate dehydrogenase [Helicobacter canadensis]|uniref:Glycerol-3-phosphate dehydrogenase [NAD(P)+] n=1 Tax=Helicobacter canadensis MIT 98-5491 TaxID=537970 RepID=C5ZY84_9HELI|nr:NAD(P)H-dependent glycerol-3-phosphate dehydrogenase [Helicobacter canadensis]EES90102.1 NAD(P)H-dependent glycerol-3-phosphate dehydrogenase [Helicobacter canadensis MIT 98-5491]EFR49257.1 putative glycerol-3-phosphate dehydrogenase [NAD(P)+] [Helicobacter canadensis MIT 98-5491]STP02392.1 NAD(P)H-dependent glycerol-3-phosphate dehydrogenase [Helicobacter canadensis]